MKKLLCILFAIIMMISTSAMADDPTTLTVLIYGGTSVQEAVSKLCAPFEEAHNCKVDVIICSLADYDQKLATMIASNTAPDALWMTEYSGPQYYAEGLIMDLSDLKADAEWDFDDFIPKQANHNAFDGGLYGIPFSGAPLVCFYNKTLVEKAGLKTPTDLYRDGEWTPDILFEYAQKLADPDNGVYGINFTRAGDWSTWDLPLTPILRMYGGAAWSDDYKTVLINSPESLKGVQAWYDLMFTSKSHPMPGTTIDFFAGQVALYPSLFGDVKKCVDLGFEWDVVPMPLNEKGESTAWMGPAAYSVCSATKNPELAKEFVKFITSKSSIAALKNTFVPTRKSVLESEDYRTGDHGQFARPSEEAYNWCITDSLPIIRTKQAHPKYTQISETINEYLQMMYAGAMKPAEMLDTLAGELEPLMVK